MATTQAPRRSRQTKRSEVPASTPLDDVVNFGDLLKRLGNVPAQSCATPSRPRNSDRKRRGPRSGLREPAL